MSAQSGWIRQFHEPSSPELLPLLVFPHAGAGASALLHLSEALREHFSVLVFQYPGRQDRSAEPALGTLPAIAVGAFADFRRSAFNRGQPITTFGHSMGALVSFEFARLAEAAGIEIRQLTVSAAVAPCLVADKPPHPTADDEILAHLARLEGTDDAVFTDPEVMAASLPVIKADYRAFDGYSCPETARVAARIHAICGTRDVFVSMRDLYGWGRHTDDLHVTMFDGGHFYLNDHIGEIADLLGTEANSR